MTSIVATVPYQYLQYTNDELELAGFGPNNFSVPAYIGQDPSHGVLHAWYDPVFLAALEAIPYVTVENKDGEPVAITTEAVEAQGAVWTANALPLPASGMVTAGDIYTYNDKYWSIIQGYDTGVYTDPYAIPALIYQMRIPGSVEEWVQPLYAYSSYKLLNLYTGKPDEALFEGEQWYVVAADGAGNNTWAPNAYGWIKR